MWGGGIQFSAEDLGVSGWGFFSACSDGVPFFYEQTGRIHRLGESGRPFQCAATEYVFWIGTDRHNSYISGEWGTVFEGRGEAEVPDFQNPLAVQEHLHIRK